MSLTRIAEEQGISLRTARRWVNGYRKAELAGLACKEWSDKGKRKLIQYLQQLIEGLALRKPPLPVATIHRKVVAAAKALDQRSPSYNVVHAIMDEDELRRAGEGEPTVYHIDMAAFDSQEKMREWIWQKAPAFMDGPLKSL